MLSSSQAARAGAAKATPSIASRIKLARIVFTSPTRDSEDVFQVDCKHRRAVGWISEA